MLNMFIKLLDLFLPNARSDIHINQDEEFVLV